MGKIGARVFLITLLFSGPCFSQDLANCGGSAGYSYFAQKGLNANSPDASKWVTNTISTGALTLTQREDGKIDLLYKDSYGMSSSLGNGGKVYMLQRDADFISVIVIWPAVSETYTFLKTPIGGEVIWTQNKFNSLMPLVSAFRAPCDFIDLSK